MSYRVNAGNIPADSWIQDSETGGGRILGEACHFIDYLTHINGSLPVSAYAATMSDPENLNDTLTIALKYENGSIGSIQYFANGSKSMAKEYVEIYCHGTTAIISDFRELKIYLLSPYHFQWYQLGNVRSSFIDQMWFVTLAAIAGVREIQRVRSSDRILSELCGRMK